MIWRSSAASDVVVLFLDGKTFADATMVVASRNGARLYEGDLHERLAHAGCSLVAERFGLAGCPEHYSRLYESNNTRGR